MQWLKKNLGAVLSILLVTFTIAIFGPLELYCTNSGEFWFSFKTVLIIVLALAGGCLGVLSLILFLLRGKGRELYGAVVFAIGVALYIQGNYANINYGILDGTEIDWGAYPVYAVLDTMGWLLLVAILLFLFFKKKKWFEPIQKYASLYIIAIQVFTLVVLLLTSESTADKSDYYLSTEGMYEVSTDENIIIFVLDSYDDMYFQEIYSENPEKYKDIFADFTYFDNAITSAARTRAALPAIVTGEVYPGEISYVDYIKESFDRDGLYTELQKQNYDVRLFTDSLYVPDDCADKVNNQESSGYAVSSYPGLTKKYFDLTLYKYMPHVLKRFFWLYTADFGQFKAGTTAESYNIDDGTFMKNMELSVSKENNAFRLYHLTGAHGPYWLDENAIEQTEPTDVRQQAKGALHIVEEYISQMKELGVYDNSTIIVMADHGDINENYGIHNDAHGILFVKTRNPVSEFTISSAPVSYAELHGTLFAELGEDKGDTFFDIPEEEERKRYFYKYTTKAGAFIVEEYSVGGEISSSQVLQATGKVLAPTIENEKYKYGTVLTFGVDSSALPFIVSGISGTDEGDYTWTSGKECTFTFPLEASPRNNLLVTINTIAVYTENGAQEIIAYVNGTLCYQTIVNEAGTISFIVPNEVIGEKEVLDLRLYLPDAISPLELFGNAGDERELALALSGLCIEETDENPEKVYSILSSNTNITCNAANDTLKNFLKEGFASPEESFTWTDGKSAWFICGIDNVPSSDMSCIISLANVYAGAQRVIISSMGEEIHSQELSSDDEQISFVIPKECLEDGVLSLQFELPDAICPKEQGLGSDARTLALAIKSISFTEVQDAVFRKDER